MEDSRISEYIFVEKRYQDLITHRNRLLNGKEDMYSQKLINEMTVNIMNCEALLSQLGQRITEQINKKYQTKI